MSTSEEDETRNWAEMFGGPAGWEGRLVPLNPPGFRPPVFVLKQRYPMIGGGTTEMIFRFGFVGPSPDDDDAWRYEFEGVLDPKTVNPLEAFFA